MFFTAKWEVDFEVRFAIGPDPSKSKCFTGHFLGFPSGLRRGLAGPDSSTSKCFTVGVTRFPRGFRRDNVAVYVGFQFIPPL